MTMGRMVSVIKKTAVSGLLCMAIVIGSCSKDEPKPEVLSLEGKVEAVTVSNGQTGTITVSYFNEDHKQEMVGTGHVTAETEILINGAAATLADVREGDHVRGDVRIEKKRGGDRIQTVTRIHVVRAQ